MTRAWLREGGALKSSSGYPSARKVCRLLEVLQVDPVDFGVHKAVARQRLRVEGPVGTDPQASLLVPLPVLMWVVAESPVGHPGAFAHGAERLQQFIIQHVAVSAPQGVELWRPKRHETQLLGQRPTEADGSTNLVVVVPRLHALFVGQLVVDRVDASLVRIRESDGSDGTLGHVPQRVLAEDAADAVVVVAGGDGGSFENMREHLVTRKVIHYDGSSGYPVPTVPIGDNWSGSSPDSFRRKLPHLRYISALG